jgi:hypothetical protein
MRDPDLLIKFKLDPSTKYPSHSILIKEWAAKDKFAHLTLCRVRLTDYSKSSYKLTFISPNPAVQDQSFFVAKRNCYIQRAIQVGKTTTLELFE